MREFTLVRSVESCQRILRFQIMIFRVTRMFLATSDRAAIKIHIFHFTRLLNNHLIFLKNKEFHKIQLYIEV